jgi:hypothetical protein
MASQQPRLQRLSVAGRHLWIGLVFLHGVPPLRDLTYHYRRTCFARIEEQL